MIEIEGSDSGLFHQTHECQIFYLQTPSANNILFPILALSNLDFGGSNPPPSTFNQSIKPCGAMVSASDFKMANIKPRNLQREFSPSCLSNRGLAMKLHGDSGSIPDGAIGGLAMMKEWRPEMYGCRISLSAVFVWQVKVRVQSERVLVSRIVPRLPTAVCSRNISHLLPQASGTTLVDDEEVNRIAEPPPHFGVI